MRLATTALIAVFALTACGGGDKSDAGPGGGADDVNPGITIPGGNLAAADAGFKLQPGQYRSTVSMQKVSAVGLPAQATAMIPKQHSFEYCITPEQAAAGIEGVKKQMAQGNCVYENFKASGGNVEAAFSCQSGRGMTLRATSRGTYTDDGSQVAVVGDFVIAGGKSIHIEETVTAKRIGACGS